MLQLLQLQLHKGYDGRISPVRQNKLLEELARWIRTRSELLVVSSYIPSFPRDFTGSWKLN